MGAARGYHSVIGVSPNTTDEAALVQGGPVCVDAEGTAQTSSKTTVSKTSFIPRPPRDPLLGGCAKDVSMNVYPSGPSAKGAR
jgi:hypothetical protein